MKPYAAARIDRGDGRRDEKGLSMADAVSWDTVKAAAAGDGAARRQLVDETIGGVWSLAMRLTRQKDLADEIVQETYARVLANLEGLRPDGRFEGYLARIATNLVMERWRRHRPSVEISDAVPSADSTEPWQAVADAEDDRRRLAAIWAATQLLYYAQGESYDEIAHILDVPAGTLKTWLHRARIEVRRSAEALLRGQTAIGRAATGEAS